MTIYLKEFFNEMNKIISALIKSEKFNMKKKTFIALIAVCVFLIAVILFCIFLHIRRTHKNTDDIRIIGAQTIASTANGNFTCSDIVDFFLIELGKSTYPYALVSYDTFEGGNFNWSCDIQYWGKDYTDAMHCKEIILCIKNAKITFTFCPSSEWERTIIREYDRKIYPLKRYSYAFSNMAYSTILSCIIESKLLLKKQGKRYFGGELAGINELEFGIKEYFK